MKLLPNNHIEIDIFHNPDGPTILVPLSKVLYIIRDILSPSGPNDQRISYIISINTGKEDIRVADELKGRTNICYFISTNDALILIQLLKNYRETITSISNTLRTNKTLQTVHNFNTAQS